MMAVPRSSKRAADASDDEAKTPANGSVEPPPVNGAAELPSPGAESAPPQQIVKVVTAIEPVGPRLDPDPGLYAVLGLDPSASDEEVQTTYRRLAARLQGGGSREHAAMRQLNVAYEVLGTRVRRDEYDRLRLAQVLAPGAPPQIQPGAKAPTHITRRSRPRHAVQPNYAGFSYVLVVLLVVGLAAAAGAFYILPHLSINLSALNALQSVMPLPQPTRSAVTGNATPSATAAPTATVAPGVAARFAGSSVSVSNATPARNTVENVLIKLRRDGQPAANADVWATVTYNTVEERWPTTGTVKTDSSGSATLSSNIGNATLEHQVVVHVFAQVDDQQYSWSTTFTPH